MTFITDIITTEFLIGVCLCGSKRRRAETLEGHAGHLNVCGAEIRPYVFLLLVTVCVCLCVCVCTRIGDGATFEGHLFDPLAPQHTQGRQ